MSIFEIRNHLWNDSCAIEFWIPSFENFSKKQWKSIGLFREFGDDPFDSLVCDRDDPSIVAQMYWHSHFTLLFDAGIILPNSKTKVT